MSDVLIAQEVGTVVVIDTIPAEIIEVVSQGPQGPQGLKGDTGPAGSDATVTSANIAAALGYTPADAATVAGIETLLAAL